MIQSTMEHITCVMFVIYRGGFNVYKLGFFGGKLEQLSIVKSDNSYIVTHSEILC